MNETFKFLVHHGVPVLFVAVFVEQIGVPLPAAPWLLSAGALTGSGEMNWILALCAATFGSLAADLIWFYLGRFRGQRVLSLLCRISLEPDSCVRRTKNLYAQYGLRAVVAGKFIPGLSTLAPPLAGNSGMSASRFILFDGLSSLLYGGSFILAGFLFSRQLGVIMQAFTSLGQGSLGVLAGLVAIYVGHKYFKRRQLLLELRTARISAEDLRQKQAAGENPFILDLRASVELEQDPALISGALHMTLAEVELRHEEIPRDRDVILYCSCPNEATSARVALQLHQIGISKVRPLLGGIGAWRERNYPTESSLNEKSKPTQKKVKL